MAWLPIAGLVPQFAKNAGGASASGYWLKFYAEGTTTAISMATDSTGAVTLAKAKLNTRGEPLSNSADDTSVFVPFLNQNYKAVVYQTEADADANNTASALWAVDKLGLNDYLSSGGFAFQKATASVFKTVADMKLGTLTDGSSVDWAVMIPDNSAEVLLSTLRYRTASTKGAGLYVGKTLAKHRTDIADAAWVPDGYGNHYIGGGSTYVAVLTSTGGSYSFEQLGAALDGTTDDSLVLSAANSYADVSLSGVLYCASSVTVTTKIRFLDGGQIKLASAATLSVSGGSVVADFDQHIFDVTTLGGNVQFETGACKEIPITWFGAIPNSEAGSIPVNNITAIDKALKAANVTLGGEVEDQAATVYRNIPVIIPDGFWSVDRSDGGTIDIPSYSVLRGQSRDGSILACKNGANSYTLFTISGSGANSIIISDFAIFGDYSKQTGTIHAIAFAVASGGKAIYNGIERMYIKEMSGNGLRFVGSVNAENGWVRDSMIRDCKLPCIYAARCNTYTFDNLKVRTSKSDTAAAGILVDGTANFGLSFNDCLVQDNGGHGIFISNTGGRHSISGGTYGGNGDKGIYIDRSGSTTVGGSVVVEQNAGEGITINNSPNTVIGKEVICRSNLRGIGIYSTSLCATDAQCYTNLQEGIYVSASSDCDIRGRVFSNSTSAHNTYSGVKLQSGSDRNNVEVMVRHGGGAVQHKYGVEISTADCDATRMCNSDLLNSGATGSFLDSGTATITATGNRL